MGEGAHDLVVADAAPGTARGGGIFGRVGDVVVRWPWIVIAVWIGLAVVLPPLFPTLVEATQKQPVSPLPADAPSIVATQQMGAAFDESGSENVLLVLLTDERARQVRRAGVRHPRRPLRRDNEHVVMIEDFVSTPALRPGLTSEDGKAWLMPIGLAGELGSPESYDSYTRVADVVRHTVEGSTLTANLTGPAATFADSLDVARGIR